jgi:hypothetical protein
MKIVYKKTNGKAHDLRYEKDGYTLKDDEMTQKSGPLPDIATLHDSDVKQSIKDKKKEKEDNINMDKSELTIEDRIARVELYLGL